MARTSLLISAALMAPSLIPSTGLAASLPAAVGHCSESTIAKIGERLEDGQTGKPVPGSGSAVSFANRGYQVSYEEEPAIQHSKVGDRVLICLVKLPENCPPGDHRGRIYTTTNLRILESWTLPDAEHSCGGA
jgi:hypothetical protein